MGKTLKLKLKNKSRKNTKKVKGGNDMTPRLWRHHHSVSITPIGNFENFWKSHYNEFQHSRNGLKNISSSVSFSNEFDMSAYKELYVYLNDYFKICKEKDCNEMWLKCKGECLRKAHKFLQDELESTVYMLNLLGNSFLSTNNTKLTINYDNQPLTGKWIQDSVHFKLCNKQFNTGRLIMGFGPSASGKTYWAKSIIKFLSGEKSLSFPTEFLSIDGGIQRETSVIYQIIKNSIKDLHGSGVVNLVSASALTGDSIFSSDTVKKNLKIYLKSQNKMNIYPNLYVPETLGACPFRLNCSSVYADYIKITNDTQWVGIYIWQHKTECNLPEKFKCNTVVKSGKSRETVEGKKYSSRAYDASEYHGNKELFRKTGSVLPSKYQIRVHNSGGAFNYINGQKVYNKSILELGENLYKIFEPIKQNLEESYNCIILPLNVEYTHKNPEFNL